MSKYTHRENVHNLESPREIVPQLISLFQPKSVLDLGCGIGTFLKVFKENGIDDLLGVDGEWVDQQMLGQNISANSFEAKNLEEEIHLDRKFDLAICLEVAEHLKESSAKQIVKSLCNASDLVVFSAAVPLQGGQNHINEQWLDYWKKLFEKEGYRIYDVLRPIFWENERIFSWYKQNMVVFSKVEREDLEKLTSFHGSNIIHPELFNLRARQALVTQKPKFLPTLKLLAKSILKR